MTDQGYVPNMVTALVVLSPRLLGRANEFFVGAVDGATGPRAGLPPLGRSGSGKGPGDAYRSFSVSRRHYVCERRRQCQIAAERECELTVSNGRRSGLFDLPFGLALSVGVVLG